MVTDLLSHFSQSSLPHDPKLWILLRAGAYNYPKSPNSPYYDDAEDDYDYYDSPPASRAVPSRKQKPQSGGLGVGGSILDLLKQKKSLGTTLLAAGGLLTFLGIMLFFEGNLLRLGNICLLAGAFLLFGPDSIAAFFIKPHRLQSTIITALGVILVFTGKPRIGLIVEIFGLLNLFGNMFPMLLAIGKRVPVVGDILTALFDSPAKAKAGRGPRSRNNYDPDYYDDEIDERSSRRMF